jgi:hypothetical protein
LASLTKAQYFGSVGYEPHPKQWLYHNSDARFRLANCGRRFGKSTMAGMDLIPSHLLKRDEIVWIVGPTYDLGEKEFRVVWDTLIVKAQLGRDKRVRKAYNKKQGNMFIQLPWNTRLEVRSADHPENLVGEALDHCILSEAAKHKEDTWQRFIRPALADKRGSADFPTTPEGHNWMYDLWMLGQNAQVPQYESWRFASWDNEAVYPGGADDPEILLLKRTMTPESFAQEIAADFTAFTGKIFPEWDVAKHVTNVPFNPALPNYMAFDWGYTNPLAAIEFQVTPRDEIHVWREHYQPYTTLEDHIRIIKAREQPAGYRLDLAFGDAADPEAAVVVSNKLVQCTAMPEAKSDYTWRDGIDLMREFMRDRPNTEPIDEYGTPGPDRPAFTVDFSCLNTIREFNNYRAPASVKGRNVPELGNRMEDHALDAIRYGLVHIYKLGAHHHLSDVYGPTAAVQISRSTGEPVSDRGLVTAGAGFSSIEGEVF